MEKIAHCDVETNGFSTKDRSLLEVYVCKNSGEEYHRYYLPEEEYSESAVKVNGLTADVIKEKRGDATYPMFYKDDQKDLEEFLEGTELFVAFNVSFDMQWMPEKFRESGVEEFCTMKECKAEVDARNVKGHKKNPNLLEAADYYGICIEDEKEEYLVKVAEDSEEKLYHTAKYDTQVSMAIFELVC